VYIERLSCEAHRSCLYVGVAVLSVNHSSHHGTRPFKQRNKPKLWVTKYTYIMYLNVSESNEVRLKLELLNLR